MKIYDRQTESYEEIEQFGAGKLNFLYSNPFGRLFLGIAVSSFVSDIYAKKKSKKSSCKDIPEFIRNHNIDMGDYEDKEYLSPIFSQERSSPANALWIWIQKLLSHRAIQSSLSIRSIPIPE